MSDRLDDDGYALCIWYERMPDQGTWFKDSQIAIELGWWRGGKNAPNVKTNNPTRSQLRDQADPGRVSRTRGHVDREARLFKGYWFGVKRNGSGPRWSHLNTPETSGADDATDGATAEQFGRLRQAEQQHGVEQERTIGKLGALEETYIKAGKIDHAMCVHDAIRDLLNTGRIHPSTIAQAIKLGIPVPVGRGYSS